MFSRRAVVRLSVLLPLAGVSVGASAEGNGFRDDALGIERVIDQNYAYRECLPGARFVLTEPLRREAEAVVDRASLLRFAERALLTLADHHAITGSSTRSSRAVVPSYADLWIERRAGKYVVTAVRERSPGEREGLVAGVRLTAIGDVGVAAAVAAFWRELGIEDIDDARAAFAARVLVAGRRDRVRDVTVATARIPRRLLLPTLYVDTPARPPVTMTDARTFRINDSLGDSATIAAFDAAMAVVPAGPVAIDLADTPGGGNTTVARAILGWFVDRPQPYQMHDLPREARETGIERRWVEYVMPRAGKHHTGPVTVRVGRWTGSMGEGLAIGFDAIGARVVGTPMAGLRGAVTDYRLPHSGLVLKLPTERLFTVAGVPREAFVPHAP